MSIDNFDDRPNRLGYSYDKSRVEDCKNLVTQYSYPDGISPYIARLKSATKIQENNEELEAFGWGIEVNNLYAGFGLVSLTQSTAEYEDAATAFVADRFLTSGYTPVIVPVDQLYSFFSDYRPSFVNKTQMFSTSMRELHPNQKFALIVSDFSSSELFTVEVLSQLPSQDGINSASDSLADNRSAITNLVNCLESMISSADGSLSEVVKNITQYSKSEKLAKLIVVMGLLMQDGQSWQDLWYEHSSGAPLVISAPESFHDAITRLNLFHGHGANDYRYRAESSFGFVEVPSHSSDHVHVDYRKQGMPAQEFERSVLPILRKLRAEQKPSFD